MNLHLETITETMHIIARSIFEKMDKEYYLAGGTALALLYGHRTSVDLDYFIAKPIDTLEVKSALSEMFPEATIEVTFEAKNTLWCVINGVKVSFIARFDTLIDTREVTDSFRVAGIKDLTVMKLLALCGREEYKDYFDLACIAKETGDARSWVSWWQKVYPGQDVMSWIIALPTVDSVQKVPLYIFEDFKTLDVSRILKDSVKEITAQIVLLGE